MGNEWAAALGLDCGASSSKWCVMDDRGHVRAEGRVAPVSGLDLAGERRGAALAALAEVADLATPFGVRAAWVGVTGLSAGSAEAAVVSDTLAAALQLGPAQVRVEGDLDLAYLAHFPPGAGVLVYAGTGAIAYHLTPQGGVLRAGGYGPLLGDEGGGFAIGRAALRHLLLHADGVGEAARGPLAERVFAAAGGRDWPTLRAYAYGGGRAAIAALAPLVGEAARAGDPGAVAILEGAGRDLAALAGTLLRRTGPLAVALAGGALRAHPRVAQACAEALPGVPLEVRDVPHERAAARLALEHLRG